MLCFYICPDSHIVILFKYPTVIAPHRQVWTDWTVVGVSPLPCTGSLLMRFFVLHAEDCKTSSMPLGLHGET